VMILVEEEELAAKMLAARRCAARTNSLHLQDTSECEEFSEKFLRSLFRDVTELPRQS
jgi:hypothetical protein